MIFDGDLGMANVDIVMGLRPRYTLADVLTGEIVLEEVVIQGPQGIDLIPGGSGVSRIADTSLSQRISLLDDLETLSSAYDFIFIDSGAGIAETVIHLNSVADRIVVVTTPEPHAMTDAYAFIKVMNEKHGSIDFDLIVNQTVSRDQGLKTADRISEVARRFLKVNVKLLGTVPFEDTISRVVMNQSMGEDIVAHTRAGQAWNDMASRLIEMGQIFSDRSWESLIFPADQGVIRI